MCEGGTAHRAVTRAGSLASQVTPTQPPGTAPPVQGSSLSFQPPSTPGLERNVLLSSSEAVKALRAATAAPTAVRPSYRTKRAQLGHNAQLAVKQLTWQPKGLSVPSSGCVAARPTAQIAAKTGKVVTSRSIVHTGCSGADSQRLVRAEVRLPVISPAFNNS